MAQLQQRVFMIFIRPCFVRKASSIGYPNTVTKYFGKIYREFLGGEKKPVVSQWDWEDGSTPTTGNLPYGYAVAIQLPELNAVVPPDSADPIGGGIERYYTDSKGRMPNNVTTYSTPPFNENSWFSNDPWLLHSTWTSFEECKNYVRLLIDLLGFDGVMVSNYIALDLELLPNK